MERVPVTSSNIAAVGYEDGVLEVEFQSGSVCAYSATEDEYRAFLNSPSIGKYFAANFRQRSFERR